MGTYIRFETDTPEKVNALYAYMNRDNDQIDKGTRVVSSRSTIMEDIAYINVDPSQTGLRHIKTVEDWNKTVPIRGEGRGQIKLSGGDLTATEKAIIDFVVNNQELFTEITEINDESPARCIREHTRRNRMNIETLNELWDKFGDTPINQNDTIDEPFHGFDKGTCRFEIWAWFEWHGLDVVGKTTCQKATGGEA